MANRVGTYLSDDNIRTMCPTKFPAPAGKSRYIFSQASDLEHNTILNQRPQNPGAAFRELRRHTGQNYEQLQQMYMKTLQQSFVPIVAIPPLPRVTPQVARPGVPTASTGRLTYDLGNQTPREAGAPSSSGTSQANLAVNLSRGNVMDPYGLAAPSQRSTSEAGARALRRAQTFRRTRRSAQELGIQETLEDPQTAAQVVGSPGTVLTRTRAIPMVGRSASGSGVRAAIERIRGRAQIVPTEDEK